MDAGAIGYIKKNIVFIISVAVAVLIIIYGLLFSDQLADVSGTVMSFVSSKFGWLYILAVFFFTIFLTWISFSKYGKIRIGGKNARPEYSSFNWFAMLFCGSTGIGLVFWSIAEPLSHFVDPPYGIEGGTSEAADFSIRTCFLHWGVAQWVCFAVVGLCLAYFQYNKGKKGLISNLLGPLLGERLLNGLVGKTVDIFTVIVSFAGVATSLGLGVTQICGGLHYLWAVPNNSIVWLVVICAVTCVFLMSAITGVDKGIKFLSRSNTFLALALLILAFIVGPHITIMNTFVNGVGQHLQHFIEDIMMIDPYGDNTWIMNWRVFYFAWFIAWTPFVGLFIAVISKGRTIREFIFGVVIVPTVFTIIWLSVFGSIALQASGHWSSEELGKMIASPEKAVFIVFEQYPFSRLLSVLVILLLAIFFITSADSATYSLSMMTSDGDIDPPVYKKVVWAIIEAAIAYILLSVGSLKPLQTSSIAASLPFLIIVIAMCPALVKALRSEKEF